MNTSAKPFPAPMGRCAQQFWASLGALVGHPSEALSGANGSVCATILGFAGGAGRPVHAVSENGWFRSVCAPPKIQKTAQVERFTLSRFWAIDVWAVHAVIAQDLDNDVFIEVKYYSEWIKNAKKELKWINFWSDLGVFGKKRQILSTFFQKPPNPTKN